MLVILSPFVLTRRIASSPRNMQQIVICYYPIFICFTCEWLSPQPHMTNHQDFEISGAPFKKFASMRDEWALKNQYISPGKLPLFLLQALLHSNELSSVTDWICLLEDKMNAKLKLWKLSKNLNFCLETIFSTNTTLLLIWLQVPFNLMALHPMT